LNILQVFYLKKITVKEARLNIKSDLKELFRVRSFIREFCEDAGASFLDDDRIADMELVSTEVVSNIIKYSYLYQKDKRILIRAKNLKERIVFLFYDWGNNGFRPPEKIEQPVAGQLCQYGLYIIECMVDKVIYSRDKTGKNCCCLILMKK